MKPKKIKLINTNKNTNKNTRSIIFTSDNEKVFVHVEKGLHATLSTEKGVYVLFKHPTLNIYQGECSGVKVHLTHKAWVGKLIFWAP